MSIFNTGYQQDMLNSKSSTEGEECFRDLMNIEALSLS